MRRAVAVVFLAAALRINAADTPKAPGDDAIAKAKQGFEALKAAKAAADQPVAALPKVDSPAFDLHIDPGSPASLPAAASAAKQDLDKMQLTARSPNWLLDAMADPKNPSGRDGYGALPARSPLTPGASASGEPLARDQPPAARRDKDDPKSPAADVTPEHKRELAAAANPLSNYMTGWMTPRDLELLGPKNSTTPILPAAAPGDGVDPAAMPLFSAPVSNPTVAPPASGTPAPENPFLAGLALPPPPAPSSTPPVPALPDVNLTPSSSPGPMPASVPVTPTPAPASRALLDEVQKSQDDAKYFKQLKRF